MLFVWHLDTDVSLVEKQDGELFMDSGPYILRLGGFDLIPEVISLLYVKKESRRVLWFFIPTPLGHLVSYFISMNVNSLFLVPRYW